MTAVYKANHWTLCYFLWCIIEKIQASSPELQHSWYLDDGVLVGSEDDLIRSWNLLCEPGPGRCLLVGVDKCELWSTVDLERLDIGIKLIDILGLEAPGAALGTLKVFLREIYRKDWENKGSFCKLDYLDDPMCTLGILRQCIVAPKMVYSLHCQTPITSVIKSLKELDAHQRKNLEYAWNCSSRRILDSSNPALNPIRVGCSPMPRPV